MYNVLPVNITDILKYGDFKVYCKPSSKSSAGNTSTILSRNILPFIRCILNLYSLRTSAISVFCAMPILTIQPYSSTSFKRSRTCSTGFDSSATTDAAAKRLRSHNESLHKFTKKSNEGDRTKLSNIYFLMMPT